MGRILDVCIFLSVMEDILKRIKVCVVVIFKEEGGGGGGGRGSYINMCLTQHINNLTWTGGTEFKYESHLFRRKQ